MSDLFLTMLYRCVEAGVYKVESKEQKGEKIFVCFSPVNGATFSAIPESIDTTSPQETEASKVSAYGNLETHVVLSLYQKRAGKFSKEGRHLREIEEGIVQAGLKTKSKNLSGLISQLFSINKRGFFRNAGVGIWTLTDKGQKRAVQLLNLKAEGKEIKANAERIDRETYIQEMLTALETLETKTEREWFRRGEIVAEIKKQYHQDKTIRNLTFCIRRVIQLELREAENPRIEIRGENQHREYRRKAG